MKLVLRLVIAFLSALVLMSMVVAQEKTATFGEKERQEIASLLTTEISDSETNAVINRTYDIVFKVLLFIVSGLAAVGAARVAALGQEVPPVWLKTSNLALTALAPLITSLAFTQFDFAKRQAVWERRHYALMACKMSIQYSDPSREWFLGSLDAILRWGDANSLNELTASCVTKAVASSATSSPAAPPASPNAAATSPSAPASQGASAATPRK